MANDDVATKAPESDAQEKSVFPRDTPAQEGPTLGVNSTWTRVTDFIAKTLLRNTVWQIGHLVSNLFWHLLYKAETSSKLLENQLVWVR